MCHRGLENKHLLETMDLLTTIFLLYVSLFPAVSFPWLLFLQFLCRDFFFFRLILLVATFCQPFSLPPLAACLS